MVTCNKCGMNTLTWVKDHGKFKLYNYLTAKWHSEECEAKDEVKRRKKPYTKANVCKHGILLTRTCPLCEERAHRNW